MMEARGVTKRYRKVLAVDNLDLTLPEGRLVSLLGPNGSGKTTLLRILAGLLKPTSGTVMLQGEDLHAGDLAVRSKIGYMAQTFSLYRDLTVAENLSFFGHVYGLPGALVKKRMAAVLQSAGLESVAKRLAGELSGGYQSRLGLAASLIYKPRYLLLDEPLAGIDPLSRRIIWNILSEAAAEGAGVLIATHDVAEAENSDHVAIMRSGRLIQYGAVSELKATHPKNSVYRISCRPVHRACAVLRQHYGSRLDLVATEDALRINLSSRNGLLQDIQDRLIGAGISVTAVDPVSPTLENVLFTLSTAHETPGTINLEART